MKAVERTLSAVLDATVDGLLDEWLAAQTAESTARRDLLDEAERRRQSRQLLDEFIDALRKNGPEPRSAG